MGNKNKRQKRGLKKFFRQRGYNIFKSRKPLHTDNFHDPNRLVADDSNVLDEQVDVSASVISTSELNSIQETDDCSAPSTEYVFENTPKSFLTSTFTRVTEKAIEQMENDPHVNEIVKCSPEVSQVDGRRIINVKTFYEKLQEISSHGPLNCGLVSVEMISEKQVGYKSTFTFQCKLCNVKFYVSNDEGSEIDVNTCAVLGTVAIGCGHSQLQELSAALDLPLMTPKVYNKSHENISNIWEKVSIKSMNDAAEEERVLALREGRVDDNGIPIIDVIVDGCWSKRSYKKNYSALSGAAVIIGKRSGKILYMGVKNKYCCKCAQAEYKNETPDEHKCFKNYSGPSTGMESSILVEGFKCSIPMHGLIYGRMISDGDSATYSKIIETRPYPNTTVQKIECKNHIMRNLCNKLTQLKTDTKYPVRLRKNITDLKIIAIRSTIKKAVEKHTSDSESDKRAHVEFLYGDILQAHIHAFGDHSGCKSYFCKYKKEDVADVSKDICDNNINEFRNSSVWSRICQIMSNVASHAPSLIHNVESNKAENFNSRIAKLVGGKRVNYSLKGSYQNRCKGAVISYNTRKLLSATYKKVTGMSPKGKMSILEKRRRLKKSQAKKTKKIRKTLFCQSEDVHYGENCTKEDMDPEIMEKEKTTFINNLQKSKEERDYIERATVLQSSSSEWLELRRKLLTASNFGRVIKRRPNISCSNLVKDLIYKDSISHVKSVKHGIDNEKVAMDQISKQTGLCIQNCGLFLDENLPFLGASPDGICQDMVVEIKCPVTAYKMTVTDAIKQKKITFYKIDKNGTITINKNHNWYYQVQGQLHITKKRKCLFGLWFGEDIEMKIDVIEKDDRFWAEFMEPKLKQFYLECILPELIDPRHPRKMEIRNPTFIIRAMEDKQTSKKRKQNDAAKQRKKKKVVKDKERDINDENDYEEKESVLNVKPYDQEQLILCEKQLNFNEF